MERNHYLFSLNKKNIISNNQVNYIQKIAGEKGEKGEKGEDGLPGDRFSTRTQNVICLKPAKNTVVIFRVEPGLAYISGNSVIVAEVGDDINSELNTFEGTIQFYSKKSGEIVIKDIVNIKGEFGVKTCHYYVNLDGVDGAPGEQGPMGPSNVSEETISLNLLDNTITIPEQINPICYYTINFKNEDHLINIKSNLKNNQLAIILIELSDLCDNGNSSATLFPITSDKININYNTNITLNQDIPFVMFKIYNIKNLNFLECINYYKNFFINT